MHTFCNKVGIKFQIPIFSLTAPLMLRPPPHTIRAEFSPSPFPLPARQPVFLKFKPFFFFIVRTQFIYNLFKSHHFYHLKILLPTLLPTRIISHVGNKVGNKFQISSSFSYYQASTSTLSPDLNPTTSFSSYTTIFYKKLSHTGSSASITRLYREYFLS